MKLLQLSLRELFLLVLVCALGLGWGLHWYRTRDFRQLERDKTNLRREYDLSRNRLVELTKALNAVQIDYAQGDEGIVVFGDGLARPEDKVPR